MSKSVHQNEIRTSLAWPHPVPQERGVVTRDYLGTCRGLTQTLTPRGSHLPQFATSAFSEAIKRLNRASLSLSQLLLKLNCDGVKRTVSHIPATITSRRAEVRRIYACMRLIVWWAKSAKCCALSCGNPRGSPILLVQRAVLYCDL